MRILHIGTGYLPIVGGGIPRYVEGLMRAQCTAGHEVHYLCTGRLDWTILPGLRRWSMGSVKVVEIVNPSISDAGSVRQSRPGRELAEPAMERLAERAIRGIDPDVIHIQSLLGWPASLTKVLGDLAVPAIYTVQTYQTLCPVLTLYDQVAGELCTDFAEGRRCVRCLAARPSAFKIRMVQRIKQLVPGSRFLVPSSKRRRLAVTNQEPGTRNDEPLPPRSSLSEVYRKRREAFVSAMNRLQMVIGMSRRVTDILVNHGVEATRTKTVHLVLEDFDSIRRKEPRTPMPPLRLGLLNKATLMKGAGLLRDVLAGFSRDQVRLLVFGTQNTAGQSLLRPLLDSGVAELCGPYRREELDSVMAQIDVGLVPSIWEEAYGYVGPELLAAGVPLLASRIGGMPDYVEDGVNGFLLPADNPEAWRAKINELIQSPAKVERLARGIKPVKTMREHGPELEAIYAEAIDIVRRRKA